jgi:hypothetical protein
VIPQSLAGLAALNLLFLSRLGNPLGGSRMGHLGRGRPPRRAGVRRRSRSRDVSLDVAAHSRRPILDRPRHRDPDRGDRRSGDWCSASRPQLANGWDATHRLARPRRRSWHRSHGRLARRLLQGRATLRSLLVGRLRRSGFRRRRSSTCSVSSTEISSRAFPDRRIRLSYRSSMPPRSSSWAAPTW